MLTAVLADAGHPVVAGLLGLGAAGLAARLACLGRRLSSLELVLQLLGKRCRCARYA